METPSSSGFTRYGVVEIDVMQCLLDARADVRALLQECAYNTHFAATLSAPEGSPFAAPPGAAAPDADGDAPLSAPPARQKAAAQGAPFSQGSSSSSTSTRLFESAPVRISRERFDQLEKQVDLMLAGIINAGDDRTM
jgi:hypothetical protein